MRLFEIEYQVEIIHGEELYDVLNEPENKDVFERLKYLDFAEAKREIHFVIRDGREIVAVAGLEKNPYDNSDNEYWVKHYSVDEDYRNTGLATKLVDAVFQFASKNGITLSRSTPTEMGLKYLTNPIERAKKKYPSVKVIDNS